MVGKDSGVLPKCCAIRKEEQDLNIPELSEGFRCGAAYGYTHHCPLCYHILHHLVQPPVRYSVQHFLFFCCCRLHSLFFARSHENVNKFTHAKSGWLQSHQERNVERAKKGKKKSCIIVGREKRKVLLFNDEFISSAIRSFL